MGYTHYWKGIANLDVILKDQLNRLIEYGVWNHVLEQEDYESDVDIYAHVSLENKEVCFNGIEDEGHETFCVTFNQSFEFSFCKTARKPYDEYVVAALILITEANARTGGNFSWSSDGDEPDFVEGRKLADQFR